MSLSYEGFNYNALTFRCSEKINSGTPVRICRSDNVMACSVNDEFHGVAVDGDTGYVSVQLKGMVKMYYTGTAPATGYCCLAANGANGVKAATEGNKYLVVSVDETAHTVTFLM